MTTDARCHPERVWRGASDVARVRAFTLIEMVISLGLLSLVLGATTAVIALASRSAPDPNDPLSEQIALQSVVNQIALDAGDASEVELVGKHEVHLICDDITGDGQADTIVYAWTGVAGDPLTRALNGVTRTLVPQVHGMGLSGEAILAAVEGESAAVKKTNQTLAEMPKLASGATVFNVRTSAIAQRFKARVPSTATTWSLSGVSLWLQQDGLPDSQGAVQIWSDNNGVPGSMLTQRTFTELSLPGSMSQVNFPISLSGLSPNAAYWIVVRATFLSSPCSVLEYEGTVASDEESLARWSTSTSSWGVSSDRSLVYQVRGDVLLTEPTTLVESRGTALFAEVSTERVAARSGVHLAHRPLLTASEGADVDVIASQGLLDTVGQTVDGLVDATGGLLGGLLGGGGK